jgi:hypothetical protein
VTGVDLETPPEFPTEYNAEAEKTSSTCFGWKEPNWTFPSSLDAVRGWGADLPVPLGTDRILTGGAGKGWISSGYRGTAVFWRGDIVCHKRPLYKLRRSRTVRRLARTMECLWKS